MRRSQRRSSPGAANTNRALSSFSALDDVRKCDFSVGPLKTKDGAQFPAADLDLRLVKVWYQNRNAWFNYFGDTGFKLVPELLLLDDEDLIRVDESKEANYARITPPGGGRPEEMWINPPRQMNRRFPTTTARRTPSRR